MKKSEQVRAEIRERAVRMLLEHRGECLSLCMAAESIVPGIGCVLQTLLMW